jgi:hypothetical protein
MAIVKSIQQWIAHQALQKIWLPCVLYTTVGNFHDFYVTGVDEHHLYGTDEYPKVEYTSDLGTGGVSIWRIPVSSVKRIDGLRHDRY